MRYVDIGEEDLERDMEELSARMEAFNEEMRTSVNQRGKKREYLELMEERRAELQADWDDLQHRIACENVW